MQRSSYSFRKVYEDFKKHYPDIAYHRECVHWYPKGFATIEIWLKDGKKYEYSDYDHKLKYISERWKEYTPPSQKSLRGDKRDEYVKTFSNNLKYFMNYFKISQVELSSRTNIPQNSISQYINGRRLPDETIITKIADALGIGFYDLTDD